MAPSTTVAAAAAVDQVALNAASPVAAVSIRDSTSKPKTGGGHDYKGFVAGVFSGIAKLTGTHRLDRNGEKQANKQASKQASSGGEEHDRNKLD